MKRKWTEAQTSAINATNKKILISAAAGSGKTATLIERIIRSISRTDDPLDISRMLIVTFTKAAASELKLRIMKALSDALEESPDSKHLKQQLLKTENAEISTIDSFCLNVLRNEFQSSEDDANFHIGDENELKNLKHKSMEYAVNDTFDQYSKTLGGRDLLLEFTSVLTGTRSDSKLEEKLLSILSSLKNSPSGIEYIKEAAAELERDARLGEINETAKKIILRETLYLFKHMESTLSEYQSAFLTDPLIYSKYGVAIEKELAFSRKVLDLAENGSFFDIAEEITSFSFSRLGSLKGDQKTPQSVAFTTERDSYKKAVGKLSQDYFAISPDTLSLINEKSSSFLSILYSVLSAYAKYYSKEKQAAHIIEFDDLKAGVYKLFVSPDGTPTPLACEYSSKYDIIYIDEYQDVDPIQDSIFNALSVNSNLFMVGDIKQSIYGFRGSDPSIFGKLRKEFDDYSLKGDDAENAAIYMSNNFRCSEPIINTSNYICSHLFHHTNSSADSVGYTENDDLVFSKVSELQSNSECEFVIVDKSHEDGLQDLKYNAEIKYIVSRIKSIIAFEKKEDGTSFSYGDFAVLCDKNNKVKAVADYMSNCGMPCDDAPSTNFFSSPEILLVRSLLKSIDNPFSDVDLASVLISPFFSFSADDCIRIRASSESYTLFEALRERAEIKDELGAKCNQVISFLNIYASYASTMHLYDFITMFWGHERISSIASFSPYDGRSENAKKENIQKLYDYALAYSLSSFKLLHDFLAFLDEIIEANPEAVVLPAVSADQSNKVHIMTIHKSKGLEFPVCFIFGAGEGITGRVHDSEVLYDKDIGLCFDPAADRGLVRLLSPYKKVAMSLIKEKLTLEKIRLFYVALTRAREKLIITASSTSAMEKALLKYPPAFSLADAHANNVGVYPILKASSYGEWVLLSDPFASDRSSLVMKRVQDSEIHITEEAQDANTSSENDKIKITAPEIFDEIRKRFAYNHFSVNALLPAKLAVSDLTPSILDDDPFLTVSGTSKIEFKDKPWTLIGSDHATAAERGTATHLFLQFADFDLCIKNGIEAEIERLTEKGFILPDHAKIINRNMLASFFSSAFFERIKSAKSILREQRFNLQYPARFFTAKDEMKQIFGDEYVLVQGVMDIIITEKDGTLILADYKTDYTTDYERSHPKALEKKFHERYSTQLSYYAYAVKQLFGRAPDAVIIYSLSADKEIFMDIKV